MLIDVRLIMYYVSAFFFYFLYNDAWRIRCSVVCVPDMYLSKTAKEEQIYDKRRDVGSVGYSLRYLFDIPIPPILKVTVRTPLS